MVLGAYRFHVVRTSVRLAPFRLALDVVLLKTKLDLLSNNSSTVWTQALPPNWDFTSYWVPTRWVDQALWRYTRVIASKSARRMTGGARFSAYCVTRPVSEGQPWGNMEQNDTLMHIWRHASVDTFSHRHMRIPTCDEKQQNWEDTGSGQNGYLAL